MEVQLLQIIAGAASSLIFVTSNLPMLWKAFTTKDLKSYSLGHIGLSNCGNLIFWLYVSSLPFGPIWFLHLFNTVVTGLMLVWYLRYEKGWFYVTTQPTQDLGIPDRRPVRSLPLGLTADRRKKGFLAVGGGRRSVVGGHKAH